MRGRPKGGVEGSGDGSFSEGGREGEWEMWSLHKKKEGGIGVSTRGVLLLYRREGSWMQKQQDQTPCPVISPPSKASTFLGFGVSPASSVPCTAQVDPEISWLLREESEGLLEVEQSRASRRVQRSPHLPSLSHPSSVLPAREKKST